MCGGLNEDDPQRLMCLNVWLPFGGLFRGIRSCGLVGEGMSLEVSGVRSLCLHLGNQM